MGFSDFGDIDLIFRVTQKRVIIFGDRKELSDLDDLDLIFKVTAALCHFKAYPKLCLCMNWWISACIIATQ